jgi:ABC-type Zn uptake system ZnuABC Zn-binding protein ZnuA
MKKLPSFPFLILGFSLVVFLGVAACGSAGTKRSSTQQESGQTDESQKLKVVATTTIVADVVSQIGGEAIDLTVLLPPGTDPHTFDPTPQDIARVADADVIFANGAGLEEFLEPLLDSADAENKIIHVSEGIKLLQFTDEHEGNEIEHHDEGADPHTWTDPNNIFIWINNIEQALSELDSYNAGLYEKNAQDYAGEIEDLDAWVKEQVEQIPSESRQIITDHLQFAYFAEAYGFDQIGALISGYSTLSEPSAQELALLVDAIKEHHVTAIFVGNTVNPNLAERIAADTGIQIIFLYTGSLTEEGGEADTYLEYIRYNVSAIVNALK